jgi:hypothetical protein
VGRAMAETPKTNLWLKSISNLVDYGPILATVVAAIYFGILTTRPDNQVEPAIQWVIGILALLATTQLVDRFRLLRKLDEKVTSFDELLRSSKAEGIETLNKIPTDLSDRISSAKSISISGWTLERSSMEYRDVLKARIDEGCKVRVLIHDPDDAALLNIAVRAVRRPYNPKIMADTIRVSTGHFVEVFSNLRPQSGSGLRYFKSQMAYGIWLFDEGSERAEMWVEIYPHRDFFFPTLHLTPSKNEKWFKFFASQFMKMWNDPEDTREAF